MLDLQNLAPEFEQLPASGLKIIIKPSAALRWLYSLFYIFLCLSFFLLDAIPVIKIPLVMFVTCYFFYSYRKCLLYQLPESVSSLVLTELNDCQIQLNNGDIKKLSVLADTYVVEHLVVLCLGENRRILPKFHYSLIITAAMTGDEVFRKLKCHLLFNFSSVRNTSEKKFFGD